MQKSSNKKIIIAVSVLLVLVLAFGAVYLLTRPETTKGQKNVTVEIVMLDETSKEHKISTDAEFLSDALKENKLVDGSDSSLGFMITSADGVEADAAKQQWWKVSIDGVDAVVGVSEIPVTDGGHYEISLVEGWD